MRWEIHPWLLSRMTTISHLTNYTATLRKLKWKHKEDPSNFEFENTQTEAILNLKTHRPKQLWIKKTNWPKPLRFWKHTEPSERQWIFLSSIFWFLFHWGAAAPETRSFLTNTLHFATGCVLRIYWGYDLLQGIFWEFIGGMICYRECFENYCLTKSFCEEV